MNNYILVVDDDPNIRTGLTRELEKEFKGLATVLSCENGAIASGLLKFNAVDILITDIKMPVMNGIELLKFIREEALACKSIVLSGFDDFNLVRDALRYGALDYLLKPVDFGLLNETIYKLLAEIAATKEDSSDVASVINKQHILEFYMKKPVEKTAEVLVFEEKYGINDQNPCTSGCVRLGAVHSSRSYQMQTDLKNRLYDILPKLHIPYSIILTGEYHSLWIFMILQNAGDTVSELQINELKKMFLEEEKSIQVSTRYQTLGEASLAIEDCVSGLEQDFYDLPYRALAGIPSEQEMESAVKDSIAALGQYSIGDALSHLSVLFAALNQKKPPVDSVKRLFTNLVYSLINENAKFIEPVGNSKFTEYDIFQQIESAESLSVLQKDLFSSFNHLIEEIVHSSPDNEEYLIERAISYIQNNYNDCITLNDTAAYVYLNKNYFSSLFKSRVGVTYREYLRDYRIKQAVKLIQDSDMKVYEIAQAVGYNDSAHFIRAFKEVTGKSPSAYKL